jgi:O-antigen ligase
VINPLYVLAGAVGVVLYAAWAFSFGTRTALWLCLFLLPFRIVLPTPVGSVVGFENLFLVPDLLLPLTFGVWLLKQVAARPFGTHPLREQVIPSALAAVFIAFLLSFRPDIDGRAFLSDLQKWIVYSLAFVLVSNHCRDSEDLTRTVNALLIGGAVATLRDVLAYTSVFNLPAPLGYAPNRDAFLFSAFDLQRYQGTGWPFFINTLLLFVMTRLVIRGQALTRMQRWSLGVYGGVLVSLLALSFYRGDWIALTIALAASLILPRVASPRMIRNILLLSGLGLFILILIGRGALTSGLQERFQTLLRPTSEEHVLVRVDAMAEGWQMFREHPLTGIGLGQFGNNFERYAGSQIFGLAVDPSYYQQANNDYIQYLATTGVVGVGALAILFWTFLRDDYRLLARSQNAETRAVLGGCFLAVIAFLVTGLSQDPSWDKTYGVLLFAIFGLVWAAKRHPL